MARANARFRLLGSTDPKQDSTNLVAFDKACSSVPDVQPTTANPQGLATSESNTNSQTGNEETGVETNGQTNGQISGQASDSNASISQKKTEVASSTDESATKVKQEQAAAAKTTTESKKCAAAPVGTSTDVQPLKNPTNIASLDACVAACKKNSSCKSRAFGQVATDGAKLCRFFAVPGAQILKATSGQSFQVSDNSC